MAGVTRQRVYVHKAKSPQFAKAMSEALNKAEDALVVEMRRRSVDGVPKPAMYKGKICGDWLKDGRVVSPDEPGAVFTPIVLREYSDQLLLAMVRAHKPEYREKVAVGVGGDPNAPPIKHEHDHEHTCTHEVRLTPETMTDEQLAAVETSIRDRLEPSEN